MKKILLILLIINFGNVFSQTKKDYSEIIKLAIAEYENDSVKVYKRFKNDMLLSNLDLAKSQQDQKIYEEYENLKDTTLSYKYFDQKLAELYDDSVTVKIETISVLFFPNFEWVDKKDNDRIRRFYKADFESNRKRRPIAFISIPLFSNVNKKAIVYGSYICGGLCGSGRVLLFEKIKGKWKLIKSDLSWVS